MSLTSFIAEPDVKAKLRETFPLARVQMGQHPLVAPLTTHYPLVGTAFDYLLRFSLQRLHSHALDTTWIAEAVASAQYEDLVLRFGQEIADQVVQIVQTARKHHQQYLLSGELTTDLLSSVLLLAQIDPFFRAGRLYEPFGQVESKDLEDLENLYKVLPFDQFLSRSVCLLNPTFGSSLLVGGADVDLVLDETMIDIKTTKFLQLKREYIDQLIGYYILYRLGGLSGAPKGHIINKLGIYFSRHSYLHLFSVEQLGSQKTFTSFADWFGKRAAQ